MLSFLPVAKEMEEFLLDGGVRQCLSEFKALSCQSPNPSSPELGEDSIYVLGRVRACNECSTNQSSWWCIKACVLCEQNFSRFGDLVSAFGEGSFGIDTCHKEASLVLSSRHCVCLDQTPVIGTIKEVGLHGEDNQVGNHLGIFRHQI